MNGNGTIKKESALNHGTEINAHLKWLGHVFILAFSFFFAYNRKLNTKYQQLIGHEDENNNNVSCYNLNLNVMVSPSPSPPQPKKRTPIKLDAQFVGDDLFRSLVTRDTIDHQMNNRSKWTSFNSHHFIICIIFNRSNFNAFFFPTVEQKTVFNRLVLGLVFAYRAKRLHRQPNKSNWRIISKHRIWFWMLAP